jgi:hypothetical protein
VSFGALLFGAVLVFLIRAGKALGALSLTADFANAFDIVLDRLSWGFRVQIYAVGTALLFAVILMLLPVHMPPSLLEMKASSQGLRPAC